MTDTYGCVGPDKPGFEVDCDQIKRYLSDGLTVRFEYSHRGSAYRIVLAPRPAMVHFGRLGTGGLAYTLVAVEGFGAYPFEGDSFISVDYLEEKLKIGNYVDAEGIAQTLMAVLP